MHICPQIATSSPTTRRSRRQQRPFRAAIGDLLKIDRDRARHTILGAQPTVKSSGSPPKLHDNPDELGPGLALGGRLQSYCRQVSSSGSQSPSLLRAEIIEALVAQGFRVHDGRLVVPDPTDKSALRALHELAVAHRVERARPGLQRHEEALLARIADGTAVDPAAFQPELVEVQSDSHDELLFRYAALHWSIPVSSGYGRRLRFLVIDRSNDKLVGIIGLGDPVFALKSRDEWVAWDREQRRERLHHVMDAFVLGAVPPYSFLLCGKLVALLATADAVRDACRRKYGGRTGVISGNSRDGRLALVTTTSALGRSSVYNRLRVDGEIAAHSVGFTRGSGEFHFSNGLYKTMTEYALEHCEPTAKSSQWGKGFRNRREIVKKVLQHVGMSDQWIYHGIKREVFVLPLAHNTRPFLRGEHSRLRWYHRSTEVLADEFAARWMRPRAVRYPRYKEWSASSWRLWT